MNYKKTMSDGFEKLYKIIKTLRGPGGCPWDAEQTPDSLKSSLIEESYECVDAIIEKNKEHIKEELGDVFLMVTFLSVLYEENNDFSIDDVFKEVCEKLVRRHPHVFTEKITAKNSKEVLHQWEEIKDKVEGREKLDSVMDSVPKNFPPLLRAEKIQKKAAKKGFDWENIEQILLKLNEETEEFKAALEKDDKQNLEEELGDIIFTVVNLSRFLKIDPSIALTKTNEKFIKRFKYIENTLKKTNVDFSSLEIDELEKLWQKAKKT